MNAKSIPSLPSIPINKRERNEFNMNELKYEIVEHIGVISEGSKGWKTELNIVSWNEREPKYDIRNWSENHDRMGKGIALTKEEIIKLKEILNQNSVE